MPTRKKSAKKKTTQKKASPSKPQTAEEKLMALSETARSSGKYKDEVAYAKAFLKEFGHTPVYQIDRLECYVGLVVPDSMRVNMTDAEFIAGQHAICGAPMSGKEGEFCLLPAGKNTGHTGVGMCKAHDKKYASTRGTSKLTLLAGMEEKNLAVKLDRLAELHPEILSDEAIKSLDEEIVVARFMLSRALQSKWLCETCDGRGWVWGGKDGEKELVCKDCGGKKWHPAVLVPAGALELIGLVATLKEKRSKIEAQKLLIKPETIDIFVDLIFERLRAILPAEYYERVVLDFKETIRIPLSKGGREVIERKVIDYDGGEENDDEA